MKKSSENKKVTLIIACRNEREFISQCLDSILVQDYPSSLVEIFVIDGMSTDGTRDILRDYHKAHPYLKIIDNEKVFQQYAFNMGIKASKGDYIFIMGAHNEYPQNYVSACVEAAEKYQVDNVGGRIEARTDDKGLIAQAILGTYLSSFGIGNATFRKDTKRPVLVDTVFGGCYRRDVFERIGFYNETLKRSQDMELNLRLVRSGGKIMLVPSIVSYYYPITGFIGFAKYNFRAGKGPIRAMRITGKPLKLMHYIPALFVLGLIGGPLLLTLFNFPLLWWIYLGVMTLYVVLSLGFSLIQSNRQKNLALFLIMPIMFFVRHLMYGLGSLFGLVRLHD